MLFLLQMRYSGLMYKWDVISVADAVKQGANVVLLLMMVMAVYSHYMVNDKFERIAPALVRHIYIHSYSVTLDDRHGGIFTLCGKQQIWKNRSCIGKTHIHTFVFTRQISSQVLTNVTRSEINYCFENESSEVWKADNSWEDPLCCWNVSLFILYESKCAYNLPGGLFDVHQ